MTLILVTLMKLMNELNSYKKIAKKHQVSENELNNLINLLSKKLDKSLNFDEELNLKKANFKSLEKQYLTYQLKFLI